MSSTMKKALFCGAMIIALPVPLLADDATSQQHPENMRVCIAIMDEAIQRAEMTRFFLRSGLKSQALAEMDTSKALSDRAFACKESAVSPTQSELLAWAQKTSDLRDKLAVLDATIQSMKQSGQLSN